MVFNYVVKCTKCQNEISGVYDTNKDVVHLKKCPYCSREFPGNEVSRMRDILDKICFSESGCSFTVSEIQRKS